MIELADLPAINATLNSISFVLLIAGYVMIRRKHVVAHKRCMIAAFCVSMLFLGTYLTYKFMGEEKRFGGEGWIRPVYFVILITHVVLAVTVPVLATRTLYLGLRGRLVQHRRLARWTLPIWVYVSITGVIVYVLLFQLYKPAAATERAVDNPWPTPRTALLANRCGPGLLSVPHWIDFRCVVGPDELGGRKRDPVVSGCVGICSSERS